jgi:hypothetical protein
MLMIDALYPAAPDQLVVDMNQIGATACLVYCWRPDGHGGIDIGGWTPAHVARLLAANKIVVGSVVPLVEGGAINVQLDAVAAMGIHPPALVSLDLESPGLPPSSWEEQFDAEARRRGYGDLDYGTTTSLNLYQPDDPEWQAQWLRTGRLDPVPQLGPGQRAWQFVNDVKLQSGAVYDVSVVDPTIFPRVTGGIELLDPNDPIVVEIRERVGNTLGQVWNAHYWSNTGVLGQEVAQIKNDVADIKAMLKQVEAALRSA